jgi:carbon-monoxide dehydrogenase medium subunit
MEGRINRMTVQKCFTPSSVQETLSLLSEYGKKARVISGGTDLLMQIKHRELMPEYLISIGGISELDYITFDETGGLKIGALTKIAEIANSPVVKSKFNVLAQAAGMLGTAAVRNQATLGGNFCNAAPSADTAPPLFVLAANVKIAGIKGEKVVSLEDFFVGPGQTILEPGQLLAEIQIPNPLPHGGGAYLKQKKRKGADLAVVGVAAWVVKAGDVLQDVRIALGAVAPTPIRARKAEEILRGKKWNDELLVKAGQAASDEAKPIDDVRGSADYRKKLVAVLTRRALEEAIRLSDQ